MAQPTPDQVHVDTLSAGAGEKKKRRTLRFGRRSTDQVKEGVVEEATERASKAFAAEHVEIEIPLLKSGGEDRLVYGVVLQPTVVDSQGDVAPEEEIEKAAHRFMTDFRQHDVQHSEELADGIVPVESWIAPADMIIGGQPVAKGSWIMTVKVENDDVWGKIKKGEITGFSIGGSAVRIPQEA